LIETIAGRASLAHIVIPVQQLKGGGPVSHCHHPQSEVAARVAAYEDSK
jgi:hypothetical protein